MRRVIIGLTICVAACRDHSRARTANLAQADVRGARPVPADPVTPTGSDSAMWQDPSCEIDTTYAHSRPGELVRAYVARDDSLGFFAAGGEANDKWLDGAEECPGHAGGTDGAVVVGSYSIDSVAVGRDSARYVVQYEQLGTTTPETDHVRFVPATGRVADTIVLIRTPYGWRITGGEVGDPFMSPAAVMRQSNLDRASIGLLDSTTRAVPTPSRPAPNAR